MFQVYLNVLNQLVGRRALNLEQYVLLHTRLSVQGLVSSPTSPQEHDLFVCFYCIKPITLKD